jgi:hypothetical protein
MDLVPFSGQLRGRRLSSSRMTTPLVPPWRRLAFTTSSTVVARHNCLFPTDTTHTTDTWFFFFFFCRGGSDPTSDVIFISTFNSFDTRKHSVIFKQWFICEHQSHPHAKRELSLFFSVLESLPAFPRLSSSLVLGFSDSDAVIRRLVPNLLTLCCVIFALVRLPRFFVDLVILTTLFGVFDRPLPKLLMSRYRRFLSFFC